MNNNWRAQSADLRLSSACVDVWRIPLDLPYDKVDGLADLLADDEKTRASNYLAKPKAREFIITRAALKTILAGVLHKQPLDLQFASGPSGKPCLADDSLQRQLHFNVSHSHELALIAVTGPGQIGIDIEKIRPDIEHENLSRRFFSEREYEALQQCSEQIQLAAFFATWTRKEAIIKATGNGIATNLKQFDVSVDPLAPARLLASRVSSIDIKSVSLATIEPRPGYFASLATISTRLDPPAIRQWVLPAGAFTGDNL